MEYCEAIHESVTKLGFPANPGSTLKRMLREAGFIDVTHTAKKLPWGPWPEDEKMKELGRWARLQMATAIDAYGMAALTRFAGKSAEEAKKMCEEATQATHDPGIHVYNYQ
jgi:hypothetical protein